MRRQTTKSAWLFLIWLAALAASCQQPAVNNSDDSSVNLNVNTKANVNVNSANTNAINSNTMNNSSSAIETKEPEQYQATVTLRLETSGDQKMSMPPLKAEVARDGANRRMELTTPTGEKVIYLDINGKKLIIAPQRKEYGELNKESLGFDIQNLLLPEQIVNRVKNLKGVEQVGEEKVDGRDAIKYQYGATTNTQTKAGTVSTESVVLVDKETGLPLRSATTSESQNSSVQGINGLSLVTEMSNIRTTVDDKLFAEPTDFKQVAPEQIKQQVNQLLSVAIAILGQLMNSTPPAATTPAP